MSLFLTFMALTVLLNLSKCEEVSCAQAVDCSCTNQNEACTLKCNNWQQCYKNGQPITLTCTSGQPCEVDCDGGDQSCENAIINANGATSLTVNCPQWRDCYGATINCGNAASCEVNCYSPGPADPDYMCDNLNLNCGTSRCIIACAGDATTNDASCRNLNIDVSDPNIYSFECIAPFDTASEKPNACADAPDQVLPPTQDPTNDPTLEPTLPTTSPSKAPTTPTLEPTPMPTNAPTLPFKVIGDIEIEIEVTDPDITEEEIEDLVDETTGAYLDTLFAENDVRLTVDVIKVEGDVLTVHIIVSTNGDIIDVNEREIIEENEKGIKEKYGNKVRIKKDEKDNEIPWYIFFILGVVILILFVGIFVLCYVKNKMKKNKKMSNDKQIVEIGLTDAKATVNGNDITNGSNGEVMKTFDSDNGENSLSDTNEGLYTNENENENEMVTKGGMDNEQYETKGGVEQMQERKNSESDNDLYGAGSVDTVGNDLLRVQTNDAHLLEEEDEVNNNNKLPLNEHENSSDEVYDAGNVERVQSTSEM